MVQKANRQKANRIDKKAPFQAAKQNRIFQNVVDQIQEAILNGAYQPGQKLPSERDMRDMFQTSRGTLREALRVLEQKGLIEIRLGVNGGAMVKTAMDENLSEGLGLMLRLQKISLDHLHEFREDIEGIVTAKAAERATKNDIGGLKDLLVEAESHVEAGIDHWEEFLDVDKRFHQALARITGNPMYMFLHNMVHENIQPYYDSFLPPDQNRLKENYADLRQMLESIIEKDADKAGELARKHIYRFNQYMSDQKRLAP